MTAFTQEAVDLGIKERALSLGKKLGTVVDISTIKIPNNATHTYVGWDGSRVVDTEEDLPPYSEEFGSCIAVLAKGFKDQLNKPSYLALHHVFLYPERFNNTLKNLVGKVKNGTIEIFISGGKHSVRDHLQQIKQIIRLFTKNFPDVQFKTVDKTFGIADLGQLNKIVREICYPETCGLAYVGFDDQYRPFQVVNSTCNHPFNKNEIEKVKWLVLPEFY